MKSSVFLFAALLIVAGLLLDGAYQRLTPDAQHAQATVVDFERRNSRQVYPIFEFRDEDGKQYRVANPTQQGIFRLAAGDTVSIAYSRANPEKARIDTLWFSHRWAIAALIVALTITSSGALRKRVPSDN